VYLFSCLVFDSCVLDSARIDTKYLLLTLNADLSGTPVDQTKYRSMVGALMYLTASRPDNMHATYYCARYQAKPTKKHLTAVKRIFWYLKDTIHMGLWYPKDTGFELNAFSDSDHAGCLDSQAEYASLSACCAQVLWMRTQLTDYGFLFDKIPMYCDSKASISILWNPVQHSRTKDINLAGMFTKALPKERFKYLVRRLVHNLAPDVIGSVRFSALTLQIEEKYSIIRSYALSWKPCQGDSLNLLDHRITITNPKEDLKGIITRRGTAYPGPTIPNTSSSSLVVERETEATKDTVHPTNNGSTEDVQPPVVPIESPILTSKPVNSPIIEPVASPVNAPKPNLKPSISYPSRLQDQKLRDKANDQREIFFQIFKDLNFNISFADALILMPKFGSSIKSLLTNKDKL
nr:copia protein [Tanacetum cinerariifolium]